MSVPNPSSSQARVRFVVVAILVVVAGAWLAAAWAGG